jgi:hypothetical protein
LYNIIPLTRLTRILTGKQDLKNLVSSLIHDCVDHDTEVDEAKFGYLIGDKISA